MVSKVQGQGKGYRLTPPQCQGQNSQTSRHQIKARQSFLALKMSNENLVRGAKIMGFLKEAVAKLANMSF